jgi:DNA polymerase-3 subunit gamma/tau
MSESSVLHKKYRPSSWSGVVGHKAIVTSLSKIIEERRSQAFILSGPAGVGKTSLARIAALALGCQPTDIVEIDAATHTGIDNMRDVQELCRYRPFGDSTHRAIIVDESHGLSKNAWDSILKSTEEPPDYITWFFCTTNPAKIPATIKSRCVSFSLQEISSSDLAILLDKVSKAEKIDMPKDIKELVIKEAKGSPRQLLVNLTICQDVKNRQEAAKLLFAVLDSDVTLALCQFLAKGGSWARAMELVSKFEGSSESARIIITNYFGAAARGAKSDKDACFFLGILDAFSQPYVQSDNVALLLLSIGKVLFAGG